MQNEIIAHVSGKIKSIHVKAEETVNKDDVIVEIEK
ncbi:MAG: biotin/lipoyl-binding protein, partial [Bacteroidales bacterium]|nr:biotin/lipoyl-binding protein [Bacteroidales bacterium]